MTIDLFLTGLQQSLILAFVIYGVMLPFRIIQFKDISAEGAYPLAGTVTAILLLNGSSPLTAVLISALAAALFCMVVSTVSYRFKIDSLLSGIILSSMIYSINLRILEKPNLSLFDINTVFSNGSYAKNICLLSALLYVSISPIYLLLKTDFGLKIRALGYNPKFLEQLKLSPLFYQNILLAISGLVIGIGGSLMVQSQAYMDVTIGVGIVIHALAAFMIGEVIVTRHSIGFQLLGPLIGSIVYQQIQGIILSTGLMPSDLKFSTGLVLIGILSIHQKMNNRKFSY